MREQEILQLFREAGAFMEGHFLLTSGLHSPFYIEKFKLLQRPKYVELLAGELMNAFQEHHQMLLWVQLLEALFLLMKSHDN